MFLLLEKFESFYKGFDIYFDSLKRLDKINIFYGFITDNETLRVLYAASDIFVEPTIYRNAFNKILAEAMASSTPVVCFNTVSQKDIVDHKVTVYTARPLDAKDCRDGIEYSKLQ